MTDSEVVEFTICGCTAWAKTSCYNTTHVTYERTCTPEACLSEIQYVKWGGCVTPSVSGLIFIIPIIFMILCAFAFYKLFSANAKITPEFIISSVIAIMIFVVMVGIIFSIL